MADAPMPDLFTCARRDLRLTTRGCAKLWESAQERPPDVWEGRAECLTCPVGARNAGRSLAPHAAAALALRYVCARCVKPSDRLIANRLCVSCYNRDREARIGKNRKGTRPRVLDVLHVERFVLIDGRDTLVISESNVVTAAEAMILHARAATGVVAFAWGGAHVH